MTFFEAFGLREDPFGVTPDPRYLYLGPGHREALASLAHGVETNRGFMALVAPPGMGKTTLLFRLLERVRTKAETVFHFQTQCNAQELLRFVLADLGVDAPQGDSVALHQQFNRELLKRNAAGKRVVVVVDEAQNLDDDVLEAIRLLSDFETPQRKLMQIVLSGQQQLLVRLASSKQEQLRQRISIVARLRPFGRQATANYVDHRLRVAGLKKASPFMEEAFDLIAEHTKGVPRNINNYCFQAMSVAFGLGRTQIDREVVEEVARDFELPMEMPAEEADPLTNLVGAVLPSEIEVTQPKDPAPPRIPNESFTVAAASPHSAASQQDAFEALRTARQQDEREKRPRHPRSTAKRWRAAKAVRRNAPFALALILAAMLAWWAWQLPQTSIAAPAEGTPSSESPPSAEETKTPEEEAPGPTPEPSARRGSRRNQRSSGDRLQEAARTSNENAPETRDPETAMPEGQGNVISVSDAIPVSSGAEVVVLPQTSRLAAESNADSTAVPAPSVPSSSSAAAVTSPATMPLLAPPPSTGVRPARLLQKRVPAYPVAARTLGVEGSVVLNVVVGKTGQVDDVRVVSGNPMLATAAVDAVREWRFEPATLNGQPSEQEMTVTLNFKR